MVSFMKQTAVKIMQRMNLQHSLFANFH